MIPPEDPPEPLEAPAPEAEPPSPPPPPVNACRALFPQLQTATQAAAETIVAIPRDRRCTALSG